MYSFTDRANVLESGITFSLYGRLAIDLFTCENLILSKTKVRTNYFELDLFLYAV